MARSAIGLFQEGLPGSYQKEAVDDNIEVKSGEFNAGVIVVPYADLDWHEQRSVEEENGAGDEHSCHFGHETLEASEP